jgi:flagellar FliJ protein
MKKFHFKLDPLLELRKRKEDGVKMELAEKNREILDARSEMLSLYDQLTRAQEEELEERGRCADVLRMRATVAYRFKIKHDMLVKGQQIESLSREAGDIQKRLTVAMRDRRAIEMLRESRLRQWKKEAERQEQLFVDGINQQTYVRRQNEARRTEKETAGNE